MSGSSVGTLLVRGLLQYCCLSICLFDKLISAWFSNTVVCVRECVCFVWPHTGVQSVTTEVD